MFVVFLKSNNNKNCLIMLKFIMNKVSVVCYISHGQQVELKTHSKSV